MSELFSHGGFLLKRGRANKRWRQRYFVAFKQELFYYTDETMAVHRGTVSLRGASIFVSKIDAMAQAAAQASGVNDGSGADGGGVDSPTTTAKPPESTTFGSFIRQFRRRSSEAELTNGHETRVVECTSEEAIPLYLLIRTLSGRELDVVAANGRELGMWLAVLELHARAMPNRKSSLRNVASEPAGGMPRKQSSVQFKDDIEDVCEFHKSDAPRRVSLTALPRSSSAESLGGGAGATTPELVPTSPLTAEGNASTQSPSSSMVVDEPSGDSPTAASPLQTMVPRTLSFTQNSSAPPSVVPASLGATAPSVGASSSSSSSSTSSDTLGLRDASSSRLVDFLEHIEDASDAIERCRRVAMSIQSNVRLDAGVADAVALEGMKGILRKLVKGFREELATAIAASSDPKSRDVSLAMCHSSTDAMRELLHAAESFVMTEVSDRTFSICRRVAGRGEERLAMASGRLRSESGSRCGVRDLHRSAKISSSVAIFNGLDACTTPRDKVMVLKATVADLIVRILEQKRKDDKQRGGGSNGRGNGSMNGRGNENVKTRRTSSDWACSTDDLISLMLVVISKSSVRDVVAHVADVSSFYDLLGDIGGEDAYHVTTFSVAVEYLLAQSDDTPDTPPPPA